MFGRILLINHASQHNYEEGGKKDDGSAGNPIQAGFFDINMILSDTGGGRVIIDEESL